MFEQLDIARQTHAHVRAFNQVVAEQRVRRKPVAQNLVKRADVVDRLAVKIASRNKSCCASETVLQ